MRIGLALRRRLWTILLALGSISLVPVSLEIGLRFVTPSFSEAWPVVFDPEVGFRFAPDSEVRHTNSLDFWTTSRTNSLGFLDQEPIREAGGCQVSIIGDSFVEAAQIPLTSRFQRLLEDAQRHEHPQWRLTTAAFGNSGTGQVNQIPFYEKYAHPLSPRLVVLVFVSNDYANNSAILESLRYGWSPDAAPRVFPRRISDKRNFELVPIAREWNDRLLSVDPGPTAPSLHVWLTKASSAYRWAFLRLGKRFAAVARLDGLSLSERIVARARRLRENPTWAPLLEGWEDAFAGDLDAPFNRKQLPFVYAEAVESTRFGFSEFMRRTRADGARLVVLAASQISLSQGGRETSLPRLGEMLRELGIPLVDQYGFILSQGGDPMKAQFAHDGHWSADGHRWAAQAISQYLDQNPGICEAGPLP